MHDTIAAVRGAGKQHEALHDKLVLSQPEKHTIQGLYSPVVRHLALKCHCGFVLESVDRDLLHAVRGHMLASCGKGAHRA